MDELEKRTRKDMFEKRRKNTKFISILLVVSVILLVSLVGIWLFGGGSSDVAEESEEEQETKTEDDSIVVVESEEDETASEEKQLSDESVEEETTEDQEDENQPSSEELVTEEVEPSDDNVVEAYTGNWEPVGTEQEEPHTVNYSKGSQDRQEMDKAILLATGLNESDYTVWWVANGGDQKVIATVTDNAETEIYRVYLSWIEQEGWQSTKVEELKENDWEKYK